MPDPLLLTIHDAALQLAISRSTLCKLLSTGDLEAIHIGRAVRIPVEALDRYIRALRGLPETERSTAVSTPAAGRVRCVQAECQCARSGVQRARRLLGSGGREVEGSGPENRSGASRRGFESLPLLPELPCWR